MKASTISEQIVQYKKANPKAKYFEIAMKFKCNVSLVGAALKKAGMTKTRKKPTKGQKILREVLKQEVAPIPSIHALNVEIYNLRQQIAGYVAVISYLENKLGMKDGATV